MARLDRHAQREILDYIETRIQTDENPRRFGKALKGNLAGLWRYRIRDYRMLCRIQDDALIVHVVAVGHRKNVYDD